MQSIYNSSRSQVSVIFDHYYICPTLEYLSDMKINVCLHIHAMNPISIRYQKVLKTSVAVSDQCRFISGSACEQYDRDLSCSQWT